MNKKKWLVGGAIVLAIGASVIGFTLVQKGKTQSALAASGEETAIVQRGTLQAVVEVSGNLAPSEEVSLMFTASEPVAEVWVKEGDEVKAGQVLARLDTTSLELEVAQAEADLALAEVDLTDTQNGAREEEIAAAQAALNNARANYNDVAAGSRPEEIASAQAEMERAAAEVKKAEGIHERRIDLPGETSLLIGVWEATSEYEKAAADYQATVKGASDAERQASWAQVQEAQAELDELKNGATSEELKLAELAIEKARVALKEAQLALEEATLTAPIAGTITAVAIVTGEIPSSSAAAVVLSDLATLEIEIDVDETDVAPIVVGQAATFSLDALPNISLVGEVTHIAPTADATSGMVLYPITLQLTEVPEDLPVYSGMTAEVEIVTASQEATLIIPLRAIHSEDGHTYVNRIADGQIKQVKVELGMVTDTEVEILSGLEEGDVVSVVVSSETNPSGFQAMRGMRGAMQ